MREECGRVVINQTQPEYLGANRATNNTAELSAVHHALSGARELRRPEEAVLMCRPAVRLYAVCASEISIELQRSEHDS